MKFPIVINKHFQNSKPGTDEPKKAAETETALEEVEWSIMPLALVLWKMLDRCDFQFLTCNT